MKKILVSAYGCEYGKGSESGVGWNWILILAKRYELWVITRSNNKENIEQYVPEDIKDRLHVIYYDLPERIRKLKKREKGLYWYYSLWQRGILGVIKKDLKDVQFDYVMHLTFGSLWMPTHLHKLNIPFIWGPIGGGEAVPTQYMSEFGWKERLVQMSRKIMMATKWLNIPMVMRCKKATLIIARTSDTIKALPVKDMSKVVVILETAVETETLQLMKRKDPPMQNEKVNLIYAGRLIPLKGVRFLIEAMSMCRNRDKIIFTIIGKGYKQAELKKLAEACGVDKQVKFLGHVDRSEVLEMLKQADIFGFPSLKEGGTWSLMEAMAAELPCICLNTSGMKTITDEESAIRIEPQKPADTIIEFSKALDKLIDDRDFAVKMGKNARSRIENIFTWKAKSDTIFDVMDEVEKRG